MDLPNTNAKDILDKIENNEIVLPDFQRGYVWSDDVNKQKSFLASILAKIPVGNIILFTDDSNAFENRMIGFKKSIKFETVRQVSYLLDGQQRLTTISLFFTDRIFEKINGKSSGVGIKDLLSQFTMRRRFFLRLKSKKDEEEWGDIFGFDDFDTSKINKIDFTSDDIFDGSDGGFIEAKTFTNKNKEWYGDKENLNNINVSTAIVDNCVAEGIIPLYFLIDNPNIVKRVVKKLCENRAEKISEMYHPDNADGKRRLIDFIKKNGYENKYSSEDTLMFFWDNIFPDSINERKEDWRDTFISYLVSCYTNIRLNVVNVADEKKSRAINIYEKLNEGGSKLGMYDLFIARVAQDKNGKNYNSTLVKYFENYCNNDLLSLLHNLKLKVSWNSAAYLGTINKNSEIVPDIKKRFMELMSLKVYSSKNKPLHDNICNLRSDYIKCNKILDMSPSLIIQNTEIVICSLIDALMFMQFRLGISSVSDVGYKYMILALAYAFMIKPKDYSYDRLCRICEAWYWHSLFTGLYQYNQSSQIIESIIALNKWILLDIPIDDLKDAGCFNKSKDKLLNVQRYNDFDVLTCKNGEKIGGNVYSSIIQFVNRDQKGNFLDNDDNELYYIAPWFKGEYPEDDNHHNGEDHHLIPLRLYEMSNDTSKIRDKSNEPINSPLNRVIIPSKENRLIKDSPYDSNFKLHVADTALDSYVVPIGFKEFRFNNVETRNEDLITLLKGRYDLICAKIKNRIEELLFK